MSTTYGEKIIFIGGGNDFFKQIYTPGNLPFTILEDPTVLDPQTSGPGSSVGVLHSAI